MTGLPTAGGVGGFGSPVTPITEAAPREHILTLTRSGAPTRPPPWGDGLAPPRAEMQWCSPSRVPVCRWLQEPADRWRQARAAAKAVVNTHRWGRGARGMDLDCPFERRPVLEGQISASIPARPGLGPFADPPLTPGPNLSRPASQPNQLPQPPSSLPRPLAALGQPWTLRPLDRSLTLPYRRSTLTGSCVWVHFIGHFPGRLLRLTDPWFPGPSRYGQ